MTLSPSIATYFGNSALLTFVTGCVEIIRRGIWNLFRVEKEHLKNCNEFKAIPDMNNIEEKLDVPQNLTQVEVVEGVEAMREMVRKEYLTLIKRKIERRDEEEKEYNEEYEQTKIL